MLNNILFDKIRLPFRKEKELYSSLYKIMGFYPRNIELYKLALSHKSVGRRNEKGRPLNNERLEFLGDAVLDAVVGDIVYRHFEGKREGFLTNTRSKLVQRETLGRLAKEMGITELIVSSGQSKAHNSYMGGNAFEALVGAIYLDRGYNRCMKFMERRILKQIINIDKVAYKEVNFKSKLLEWSQKNKVKLDFELVSQSKENNGSPIFVYQAMLEGVAGGSGKGYSKKESQQLASKETLQKLRREPQYIDAVFAAKADRTKMDEMPVSVAPDTEENLDFIETKNSASTENRDFNGRNRDFNEKRHDAAAEKRDFNEKNHKPSKEKREVAEEKHDAAGEGKSDAADKQADSPERKSRRGKGRKPSTKQKADASTDDEFDLSDITATPKELSKADIIAMAEEAAFNGEE